MHARRGKLLRIKYNKETQACFAASVRKLSTDTDSLSTTKLIPKLSFVALHHKLEQLVASKSQYFKRDAF